MRAFKNITVLDMSQGIAGPVCAEILARQGAQVIKVEPLGGDWMRGTGDSRQAMSANVISGNLNKRGLAIDAAKPAGREVLLKLASQADVLVENFRTGVMARLGMGYATLKALNPGLVFCSISGFGAHGPYAAKAATDSVVQGFTGMVMANGIKTSVNGELHTQPKRIALYVPDNISAIYAAQAVSAALFERAHTKLGQHVEVSLAQASAAFQAGPMVDSFLFPESAKKGAILAPSGEYRTADGWIVVAALTDEMFTRLARAVDRESWLSDARFVSNDTRREHVAAMNEALSSVLSQHDSVTWLKRLEAADVLVSPVNDYTAFRAHEQTQAMSYVGELEQAPYGRVKIPHLPASDRDLKPAPRLGEHTRELLREAGYSTEQVQHLISQGIAYQWVEPAEPAQA